MTLPEIEAEIARLTDEVSRLTTLRDEMVSAQVPIDIERALADPEIRAAYAQAIERIDRGGPFPQRSPETLEWLARNNLLAGVMLICLYRDTTPTRSPA